MTIELNREIAEKVMGEACLIKGWPVPEYSTDIKKAWSVVERMEELGFDYHLSTLYSGYLGHVCHFIKENLDVDYFAGTVPLAICNAALKAVAEENKR